ncbi:hypothetical protein ABIE00_002547 [Arthrobacter sp. OAP107]
MRAFGVVELIERVDLFLKLVKAPGEGLFVQETEQVWWKRSFLPCVVGLYGFPVIASIPSEVTYVRSWPWRPRREGFNAAPLSVSSFWGTP